MMQPSIWSHLEGYDVILASQSPRREELLSGLGIAFRKYVIPDIDESYPKDLSPEEVVRHISQLKSAAYRSLLKANSLIITADTVVEINGLILGKPQGRTDATRMLKLLSGSTHTVYTAVTLMREGYEESFVDATRVSFAPLSEEEISYYLDTFEPYDKAGSYGIQEWIGYRAITSIEGSFYTVMGLPTQKLAEALLKIPPYADQR